MGVSFKKRDALNMKKRKANRTDKIIYVVMRGRIGNQLFIYAFARSIQKKVGGKIVMDDSDILAKKWDNSLDFYNLQGVSFVHSKIAMLEYFSVCQELLYFWYRFTCKVMHFIYQNKMYRHIEKFEDKHRKMLNARGLILCQNGYKSYLISDNRCIVLDGFFQSKKYFQSFAGEIKKTILQGNQNEYIRNYPGRREIQNRNSVCVSIKVEHNVGSNIYAVCDKSYWEKAIQYMVDMVENPLFFICSDNVEYVKKNLIDSLKYDVIFQDRSFPVQASLEVMSYCKHFIIGNTSFGWWAQYLSYNEDKIVCVPSKWVLVDMPVDIYQEGWHLIEV